MNIPGMRPQVVMLHGPAASGKLTIARELADLTGFALFHNHLTVDLLLALFPFGSPEFVRHRERIWLDLMGDAARAGRSLIFTFNPERTVGPDFPKNLHSRVLESGGTAVFVEIRCSPGIIFQRLEADSRRQMRKLTSVELYKRLEKDGSFDFPPIPSAFEIDSGVIAAKDAARQIATALDLPMNVSGKQ